MKLIHSLALLAVGCALGVGASHFWNQLNSMTSAAQAPSLVSDQSPPAHEPKFEINPPERISAGGTSTTVTEPKAENAQSQTDDDLKDIELETDHRKSELRIIRHRLKVVRAKKLKNPLEVDENLLIMQSIAAILDERGRGLPESALSDKGKLMKEMGADCGFSLNGRVYVFYRDEFPEWIERMDYRNVWADWSDKLEHSAATAGPAPEFLPRTDYFGAIEARAEEAIALLSRDH